MKHALASVGLAALIASCAAASPPAPANPTTHVHAHPGTHAMTHAMERVAPDALRCLRPGDTVAITGEFEGTNGEYQVTRVAGSGTDPLPYAVDTCVRVAVEHAHVRPFTDESAAYAYTFVAPGPASEPAHPSAPVVTQPQPVPVPMTSTVTGSLEVGSRPSPSEMIRREGDALQRCYEQAAERDHTVSGSIDLHLVLDAQGRLTRISSEVHAPPHDDITLMELVARCIEAHVRLIQFGPQSSNVTDVVVPLTFHPGGIPID